MRAVSAGNSVNLMKMVFVCTVPPDQQGTDFLQRSHSNMRKGCHARKHLHQTLLPRRLRECVTAFITINIFRDESKQKYIVESAFLMGEKMEEDLKTN